MPETDKKYMTLDRLEIGKDAVIKAVRCEEVSLRKHILDMGLTPGTEAVSYTHLDVYKRQI